MISYAPGANADNTPVHTRRIMGIETEYGLIATRGNKIRCNVDSRLCRQCSSPDEVARCMFRPVVKEYGSTNVFTDNASRLYLDVGNHPEVATAECDSLSQLIAYERAGDRMVDDLARIAEKRLRDMGCAESIYLFKNNVDSAGNSYGCHENYLVSRQVVLKDMGRALLPFLITRQLIAGAGLIRAPRGSEPAQFVLSQRADKVWDGISSATTRSRPMINTRDEPHGDSTRFRRMHVIVGDSNMAEPTSALKVGSMQLVIEMLEAGVDLPEFDLADPIAVIQEVSRDLTGRARVELADGGSVAALDIQRRLCERARDWLGQRDDCGTPIAELARVVDLWERTLDAIDARDLARVGTEIDWVIKLQLLEQFRDRLSCDWSHPKLAQVDFTYHDVRPGRGLYNALVERGRVARWVTDADIAKAMHHAPATTRANLRGKFLRTARELNAETSVDWVRMKINRPEPYTEEFADPFACRDPRLDALLDYMRVNA